MSGRAFKGGQDQFDSPVRAQDELAPSSRQDPWHIDVRYVVTVLRAMLCRICAGLLAPTLGSLWPPKCRATSRAGQVRGRDVQSDFNGASARYGFEDSKLLGSSWMDRSVLESQEQVRERTGRYSDARSTSTLASGSSPSSLFRIPTSSQKSWKQLSPEASAKRN